MVALQIVNLLLTVFICCGFVYVYRDTKDTK